MQYGLPAFKHDLKAIFHRTCHYYGSGYGSAPINIVLTFGAHGCSLANAAICYIVEYIDSADLILSRNDFQEKLGILAGREILRLYVYHANAKERKDSQESG